MFAISLFLSLVRCFLVQKSVYQESISNLGMLQEESKNELLVFGSQRDTATVLQFIDRHRIQHWISDAEVNRFFMTVCILMFDGRMWMGWRGTPFSIGILSVGSPEKRFRRQKRCWSWKSQSKLYEDFRNKLFKWMCYWDLLNMCFSIQFSGFFHKKYWRISAFVSIFQKEKLQVWFKLKMWQNGVTCIVPFELKQHAKSNKL